MAIVAQTCVATLAQANESKMDRQEPQDRQGAQKNARLKSAVSLCPSDQKAPNKSHDPPLLSSLGFTRRL